MNNYEANQSIQRQLAASRQRAGATATGAPAVSATQAAPAAPAPDFSRMPPVDRIAYGLAHPDPAAAAPPSAAAPADLSKLSGVQLIQLGLEQAKPAGGGT